MDLPYGNEALQRRTETPKGRCLYYLYGVCRSPIQMGCDVSGHCVNEGMILDHRKRVISRKPSIPSVATRQN